MTNPQPPMPSREADPTVYAVQVAFTGQVEGSLGDLRRLREQWGEVAASLGVESPGIVIGERTESLPEDPLTKVLQIPPEDFARGLKSSKENCRRALAWQGVGSMRDMIVLGGERLMEFPGIGKGMIKGVREYLKQQEAPLVIKDRPTMLDRAVAGRDLGNVMLQVIADPYPLPPPEATNRYSNYVPLPDVDAGTRRLVITDAVNKTLAFHRLTPKDKQDEVRGKAIAFMDEWEGVAAQLT